MSRDNKIPYQPAALIFLIILIFFQNINGAVRILKADEVKSRIRLHNGPIVSDSDSLIADGLLLVRDADYKIDYIEGVLTLSSPHNEYQQLTIYYTPLPAWLKKQYGIMPGQADRPLPSVEPPVTSLTVPGKARDEALVSISGAKKFSIISQTGGTSQFNQSLEMTIRGEISPGLEIAGSVADRGYDPAYGAINSRISELDKLNLKIYSKTFYSEIGNLEFNQSSAYGGSPPKQVSGIKAAVKTGHYDVSTMFGRPRGRFKTVRFQGQDRIQGPYRVAAENRSEAIVPGSEKAWVDGQLLERGADKDYIMDYPAATITFTPRILVDSRSRIEIDFEPLTSDYQREIYQASGGVMSADSTVFFKTGFIREGDSRDRLKVGELGAEDIALLENIGDSVSFNTRDGAVFDTNGSYMERFDTTGDRYFEYVGDSAGEYRVAFSPVGSGDYLFDGNDIYRYVGRNNGDYLPVIKIPVPEREDYFETELGLKPWESSRFNIIMRHSSYDRNLYSALNDNNNIGGQYLFLAGVGGRPTLYPDKSGLDFSANIINKNFKARTRRNRPDRDREFLIPDNLRPLGDEREYDLASSIIIPGPYNFHFNSALLDYDNQFNSYYGAVMLSPDNISSLLPMLRYRRLTARYDTADVALEGVNETYNVGLNYDITDKSGVTAGFGHDRRQNQYYGTLRGTTEKKYNIAYRYGPARIELEKYDEDTLLADWKNIVARHQGRLTILGKIGDVGGEVYLTARQVNYGDLIEEQLMARVRGTYSPVRQNLVVGASYALSDENRFERGVRYIEVESGQGQFILVDGQYIPDADGNYIEIEEIHSSQAQVSKGEKSFQFFYNPTDVYLKLTTNSTEDLLESGNRTLLWMLPFYSDGDQPYLLRRLSYQGETKLLHYADYYFFNLTSSYNFESRRIGGSDFNKSESAIKGALNEASGEWRFIEEGNYFRYKHDSYYSSPDNIDGYKVQMNVIRIFSGGQLNGSAAYRFAEDENGARSKQYIVTVNPRLRLVAGGETSIKLEGYRQDIKAAGFVSYRLIDNRYGGRGFIWSIRSDYRVKKDLRINISFSGRHSDDRKPRITGRGEIIASF
ncbi:MAG: hypothetical protein CVT49_01255 [candidate division Zixibacteria bacterium HGW-Zixibacteria-1]|nr:MAG: hypothetical protein CVT49_01255 [candidate division Zixibacteria bacterium HGW-Zixibacteria-1]